METAPSPAQVQQQPAAVYMVMSGPGEGTPMYAYSVQAPDGRVMYHLIPAAQRAVRAAWIGSALVLGLQSWVLWKCWS